MVNGASTHVGHEVRQELEWDHLYNINIHHTHHSLHANANDRGGVTHATTRTDTIGISHSGVEGMGMVNSHSSFKASQFPSSVTAMIVPPRDLTSSMDDTIFE